MCKILRYRPWLSQPNGEIEQVVYVHIVTGGTNCYLFMCALQQKNVGIMAQRLLNGVLTSLFRQYLGLKGMLNAKAPDL